MKIKNFSLVFTAISVLFITGCATTIPPVSYDASEKEIIQMAQSAYDQGKINHSLYYYNEVIKRYGMNTAIYIEANYEIAHIELKKKNYNYCTPIYEDILSIYSSTTPGTLPGSFQILAANDYAKIPAEYKTKK